MTGYALRKGLTFCRVDGRFVFLDLPRDRYFCLSPIADQAFRDVIAGESPAWVAAALRDGLLRETSDDTRPVACIPPAPPRGSLHDNNQIVSRASVLGALTRRAASRVWLRARPLKAVLDRVQERKSSRAGVELSVAQISRLATAYRRAGMLVSAHDQCLATSVAVAWQLASLGATPHLILGVKLYPFQAHCWVQLGDVVVNDQLDAVRLFTPILVV